MSEANEIPAREGGGRQQQVHEADVLILRRLRDVVIEWQVVMKEFLYLRSVLSDYRLLLSPDENLRDLRK